MNAARERTGPRQATGGAGLAAPSPRTLPRLLPPDGAPAGATLRAHLARHGEPPALTTHHLAGVLDEVARSGLTGRGGGGFPTARKLATVAAGRSRPAVVVNASESEPASRKDEVLALLAPHLVLDGAGAVAGALGAVRVVVATHHATAGPFRRAAAERARHGRLGLVPEVVELPEGFVAGEESAVVNFVDRGVSAPTTKPPLPAVRGLDGRPTLVSNAETFAHLALVLRHGARWFRGLGTADEPGSRLVTLHGAVARPGVYEVELGTPLDALLASAGGPSEPVGSLLVGGFAGTFLPAAARSASLSKAGLAPYGARPGAGLVTVLPRRVCGLAEATRLAAYLASQSAGQCGPCAFGLPAVASALGALVAGQGDDRLAARLWRWLGDVKGRGACAHPDATAAMIESALGVHADELAHHRLGRCTAASPGASVLGLDEVHR